MTTYKSIEWTANELGFQHVIRCTKNPQALLYTPEPISKVIVLSDMLPTISFFVELVRFNLNVPVTLVTHNRQYSIQLYKTIGAKYVVYTNCDNVVLFFLNEAKS
ncbi:hypothetical protein [Ectobacillus panaciterrae]|uniref:hypothetical protein n=1 Tax=Ectobacillus panaciterrae TaxID=363872 RepID=UPI0004174662|nr:hypothetical protein [Ectobacillus panaciterrae]